jgi:hypothetical protein
LERQFRVELTEIGEGGNKNGRFYVLSPAFLEERERDNNLKIKENEMLHV